MKTKIFIDGSEGTTGLRIFERFEGRDDIELLKISSELRKDPEEIKKHFSQYLQELRESPKADGCEKIYTHGEKEVAAVERIMRDGVPVNDNTMVEVLDLCNYLGLDFGSYFGDYRPPVKEDVFKGNY